MATLNLSTAQLALTYMIVFTNRHVLDFDLNLSKVRDFCALRSVQYFTGIGSSTPATSCGISSDRKCMDGWIDEAKPSV